MYARQITTQLKGNVVPEFTATIERQILPMLRKEKGFLDEMILISPNRKVLAISVWEDQRFAETHQIQVYPEIMRILDSYLEGIPTLETFEVGYATLPAFRKFAAVSTS